MHLHEHISKILEIQISYSYRISVADLGMEPPFDFRKFIEVQKSLISLKPTTRFSRLW